MVATLLVCMPFEVNAENLQFLTAVILVHNMFCATQDVAIDALACTVLHEDEQGLGNGLMFAGQKIGFAIGGACVLFLTEGIDIPWLPELLQKGLPFQMTYPYVIGCILAVTFLVAWPIREEPREHPPADDSHLAEYYDDVTSRWDYRADNGLLWPVRVAVTTGVRMGSAIVREVLPRDLKSKLSQVRLRLAEYVDTAGRSVFGNRVAFVALLLALLPPGAMALDLALQKQVAKEIGFTDGDVARIDLISSIVWSVSCILGGLISDRLGHLKCLAVFFLLISIPTFWSAWRMDEAGMNVPKIVETADAEATESDGAAVSEAVTDAVDDPGADEVAASETEDPKTKEKEPGVFERADSPPMAGYFWWAVMAYMVCQGLMYGTRTAIFMRIANPDVAATQFTAYMSMMNLVTSYTAVWQGWTIERFGFAQTLYIDGFVGLFCIGLLPFLRTKPRGDQAAIDVDSNQGETEADV
jgi:PAT family beta-lactamase induction signal transducer AmpG